MSDVSRESSIDRVRHAADSLGLSIHIQRMNQSTRTAEEAAVACGCSVAQIVKSLVFENAADQSLVLCLVSGGNQIDTSLVSSEYGISLKRCDARRVREETGFAIGGVAPIGHLTPVSILMDETLMRFGEVWAAAGRPDSVFRVEPQRLADATRARLFKVTAE